MSPCQLITIAMPLPEGHNLRRRCSLCAACSRQPPTVATPSLSTWRLTRNAQPLHLVNARLVKASLHIDLYDVQSTVIGRLTTF